MCEDLEARNSVGFGRGVIVFDVAVLPDFIKADAMVTTGLIDGLAEVPTVRVGDSDTWYLQDVASLAAFAGDVSQIQDMASPRGVSHFYTLRGSVVRAA